MSCLFSICILACCHEALVDDSQKRAPVASLKSTKKERPAPVSLETLIDRADKLVVLEDPFPPAKVLYESSTRRDFGALKTALKIEHPKQFLHCMCDGTPAIVLYSKGERTAVITNHHAELIRCNLWESDAKLADPEPLLKWFDERKIPGPRAEYVARLKLEKESREAERKWIAAMPPAIKPHWNSVRNQTLFGGDLAPLRKSLETKTTDKNERILSLLTWYGSGQGPWSPFPAYEGIAEELLFDYPTSDLLAAIKDRQLTTAQTEGLARFLGGWHFSQSRPQDLKTLPKDLKSRLLKHSLDTKDEDKRSRAINAFGTTAESQKKES